MLKPKIEQWQVTDTDKHNNIEVKLMANSETGVRFIRVELTSRILVASGKAKSNIDIYPSEVKSEKEFKKKVEAAAGYLAEYQCHKYGDVHDPSEVARMAVEAWEELKQEFEESTGKTSVIIH